MKRIRIPSRLLVVASALALLVPAGPAVAQPKGASRPAKKEAAAPERAAPSAKKAPAPAASDTWYAQRVTRGDTGVIVASLWSKGRRLRADAVIGGVPIVTIVNGEFYYVIDGLRQVGMVVRRNLAALEVDRARPGERPFGGEGRQLVAKGAELVREEEIAGRNCQIYRLTDELGRHEVWVTADEAALPLRIDQSDRSSGARVVTDYVDWLRELDLPDSFFEPDPRIQLERLEYQEYLERSAAGPVGPAPVLFSDLLHGR
jgi:hypothetical protein